MLARRLPSFVAAYTDRRSACVRPSWSAFSAASLRLVAPSLPRIADTWCSTVLTDMNNLAEISSLDWPWERSSRICCSRAVSPRGWALVAGTRTCGNGADTKVSHSAAYHAELPLRHQDQ